MLYLKIYKLFPLVEKETEPERKKKTSMQYILVISFNALQGDVTTGDDSKVAS